MKTLLAVLTLTLLAVPAMAQSGSSPYDLSTSIPAYQVVKAVDVASTLNFDANPESGSEDLDVSIARTLEYATNYASSRAISLDVDASAADDWYNLTMDVSLADPSGAAAAGDPSVGKKADGSDGSLGTKGSNITGADADADIEGAVILNGIQLAHGQQVVTFQVNIKNVTETTESNARTFTVTYTIDAEV